MKLLSKLIWYLKKALLLAAWLLRDWIRCPRMRFYFSSSDWEGSIRRLFKWTKHDLAFGDMRDAGKNDPDIIVPLNMEDVLFISENRDKFPSNRLGAPDSETLNLLNDKARFNEWLKESRFADLALDESTTPPFMLKPSVGQYGEGCQVITTQTDYEENLQKIQSTEFVCHELLVSKMEYATHLLVNEGTIHACLCIEYNFHKDVPIKGIDSPWLIRITRESFPGKWRELMQALRFTGICCLNYKIMDGHPKLMEINPRFGGSLAEYFFSFARDLSQLK